MKADKTTKKEQTTLTRIIETGRKEFLKLGFKDASLRNIVKNSGVTTGAFYGYFPNKNALFTAIVAPAADKLRNTFINVQTQFSEMPPEIKYEMAFSYSKNELSRFIDCIYEDFEAFKLIICRSAGTSYENYIHSLVEIEVEYTQKFLKDLAVAGLFDFEQEPDLMHILFSSYFHAVFEAVAHDMSRIEAENYIGSLCDFFSAGWKKLWKM